MECRYSISFSSIVIRVIFAIIINKPNDLFAHAKPIFTLIVLTCTTYGIQSSHKCYTEPYFVRLLVCLTRMSTASLMLLFRYCVLGKQHNYRLLTVSIEGSTTAHVRHRKLSPLPHNASISVLNGVQRLTDNETTINNSLKSKPMMQCI